MPATISLARLRANRLNARKSTGPRTVAGKARAAQNALRHGLFCKSIILPGESTTDFLSLQIEFHSDLLATDSIEFALIERMVLVQWKLRRVQDVEYNSHGKTHLELKREAEEKIKEKEEERDNRWNSYSEEDEEAARKQKIQVGIDTLRTLVDEGFETGQIIAADFATRDGTIDRAGRYEQRLSNQFHKLMNELRAYRKHKPRRDDDQPAKPYADLDEMRCDLADELEKELAQAEFQQRVIDETLEELRDDPQWNPPPSAPLEVTAQNEAKKNEINAARDEAKTYAEYLRGVIPELLDIVEGGGAGPDPAELEAIELLARALPPGDESTR